MEDKERELIFEVAAWPEISCSEAGRRSPGWMRPCGGSPALMSWKTSALFVLSNGIFLTSETEGSNHQVRVRHIPLAGARLDRIDAVNELSREIELGFFTPTEAKAKLKRD